MESAPSNYIEASANVVEPQPNVALPLSTLTVDSACTPHNSSIRSFDARTLVDGARPSDLGRLKALECNDHMRYNRKFRLTRGTVFRNYVPLAHGQSYTNNGIPDGWEKFIHPEGNVYFYHKKDKILTQNWVEDEAVAHILDTDFRPLLARVWKADKGCDYNVVVDIVDDDKSANAISFAVYIADHKKSSIFWINVHDGFKLDLNSYGLYALDAIQKEHHLEVMYWKHVSFFPHVHKPTKANWKSLFLALTSVQTDVATSNTSTSFQSESQLANWMAIAQTARQLDIPDASFTLGRFMHSIRRHQIFHYHGTKYARLHKDDSVFPETNLDSICFQTFSILLFYVPVTYVGMLNSCWVDRISQQATLTEFISGLNKEWKNYSFMATVFLTANMAFLAIPAFDNRDRDVDHDSDGSWTQAFIFLSIFASLGCIVMASLLLQRQYAPKKFDKVGKIHQHLSKMSGGLTGLHGTAIVYSLPYALLLWSVIFFSAGVLSVCFKDEAVPATRIVMGIVVFLTVFAVLWSLEKLWHVSIWIGERLWEASDWTEGKVTWIRERVAIPYRSGTTQTTDASSNV